VLLLPPLRLGIEPGSRENETDFEGLEGHYTRITAGRCDGWTIRGGRQASDLGLRPL